MDNAPSKLHNHSRDAKIDSSEDFEHATYEEKLGANLRWALSESSKHFEQRSAVFETLRRICQRLEELDVPYSVVGGLALFAQGVRRYTEDVDILVTEQGLKRIHRHLDGLGYSRLFIGSKNIRDVKTKVQIEFLITGQYPGDGKPKDVAFPDPSSIGEERDGVIYARLEALIELKLASGMTGADRKRDISDVQELIRARDLPAEFAQRLNPSVRDKFIELRNDLRREPKRYMMIWRNKFLTLEAKSVQDMIDTLRAAALELDRMKADGVVLDPEGGTSDDYALLTTTDPDVAKKYDMHEESEFWGEPEEDEDTDRPGK